MHRGQGIPAPPHVQACWPSQGVSGWFSQTQPQSSQTRQRNTVTSCTNSVVDFCRVVTRSVAALYADKFGQVHAQRRSYRGWLAVVPRSASRPAVPARCTRQESAWRLRWPRRTVSWSGLFMTLRNACGTTVKTGAGRLVPCPRAKDPARSANPHARSKLARPKETAPSQRKSGAEVASSLWRQFRLIPERGRS